MTEGPGVTAASVPSGGTGAVPDPGRRPSPGRRPTPGPAPEPGAGLEPGPRLSLGGARAWAAPSLGRTRP